MARLSWGLIVLVLAACPAKRTTEPSLAGAGVGCPSASGVYIASYVRSGDDGKGHAGWVLPLHDAKVASLDGVAEFATIDPAAAAAAGVPAPPQNLWLMLPNAAPCKATIGGYYAAAIDVPTKNIAYGAELAGCAAPADPSDAIAIALVSEQVPGQCVAISPRPIATRLGETDKANVWSRPTKETPIPPAFAKVVPAKDCAAPGCEKLWSIAQVEIEGKPIAWAGAINWLAIPPGAKPASQCEWKTETFAGFFIAGPDGDPVQVPPIEAEHPLVLTAVLRDSGGARILLALGTGEYAAYDLSNGEAKLGRHLVWLIDHPESYGSIDRIGPDCGL